MSVIAMVLLLFAPCVEMVPVSPVFRLSLSRLPERGPQIEIRNHCSTNAVFKYSGFYPNHRWTMRAANGALVGLTKRGEIGTKQFGGGHDGSLTFDIEGGKSYRYTTPPLTEAFLLAPGTYTLHIFYHEKHPGPRFERFRKPPRFVEYRGPPLTFVCPTIKVIVSP